MAGPWEKYAAQPATQAATGPWSKYAHPEPVQPEEPRTPELNAGFAPRAAREQEFSPEQLRAARKEMYRGEAERNRTLADSDFSLGTAWRGMVGMVPFADDAVAALAATVPSDLDYSGSWTDRFQKARDAVEAQHDVDWEKNPGSYIVGGGYGLLRSPGGKFIAEAKNLPSLMGRSALVGGAYGTAGGASSNGSVDERAARALTGGALGTLVGGAAPAVTRGIGKVADEAVGPVFERARGWMNPEKEADRIVGNALRADRAAGRTIAEADLAAAQANGQPLVLGDIGGDMTRAVARNSANASPTARGIYSDVVDPRYQTQGSRFGSFVSNLFDHPDPTTMRDTIRQVASRANDRAYRQVYGEFPVIETPELRALINDSPLIGDLAKKVLRENPDLVKAGMSKDMSNPSLEFWDRLQRQLRQGAEVAGRQGAREDAAMYQSLRSQLLGQLDAATNGRFQQVRQGAAQFFGAEDAIEAGQNFFRQNSLNDLGAARKALAAMSDSERTRFAQGFAAEMAHASTQTGESRNLVGQAFLNSPNARAKMELALGPERAGRIQSFANVESSMNLLRNALQGNSTTVRQLIESGVLGAGVNAMMSGDIGWHNLTSPTGIAVAVGRTLAARNRGIDAKTAERIARRLASSDPAVVNKVLDEAMRQQGTRNFLRAFEGEMTKIGAMLGGHAQQERPKGYAEGGEVERPMRTEPKTGEQYYGPEEDDRRLLESLSPGGERYVAPPPTEYPGDRLQAEYKDSLPLGVRVPRNAVELIQTDEGSYPVDAEGRKLDWARQPGMLPVAKDKTGYYPVMPVLPDLASNVAGGGTEGAGMLVGSGLQIPRRGRAAKAAAEAKAASEAAGAAPDVAKVAEDMRLPAPAADPLAEAAARTEMARKPEAPPVRDEPALPASAEEAAPTAQDAALPPDRPAPATGVADSATDFHMTIERDLAAEAKKVRLSGEEKAKLSELATSAGIPYDEAEQLFRMERAKYPPSEWAPIAPAKITKNAEGVPELQLQEAPYNFHKRDDAARASAEFDPKLVNNMSRKLADEVLEVAKRAETGDRNAQVIMRARNWYAAMRDRLRAEFGSFADVFADVLGTTSAQTNVRQNWDNAVEALSLFTKGYYDDTLTKLDDWFKNGGVIGNAKIDAGFLENGWVNNHEKIKKEAYNAAFARLKEEGMPAKQAAAQAKDEAFQAAQAEFPLITKGDGKTLFNANSPSTMGAFLDLFRQVQPGAAPKTPNFTGNLIGYSRKATIDVWAARLLRRLSGRKPLPPGVESGVGGVHMADTSKISGEFGFGQEVFSKAADILRKDPRFKDLGDDDLQAIVWFLEKENWAKKGWTNKAGEGGSLEYEANLAGIDDRDWVKTQRRLMDTDPTAAERKKLTEATNKDGKAARDAAAQRFDEVRWTIEPYPNGSEPTAANVRDHLMQTQGITDAKDAFRMAKEMQSEARQLRQQVKLFDNKVERLDRLSREAADTKGGAAKALDEAAATVRRMVGGLSPDRVADPATDVMFSGASKRLLGSVADDPALLAAKASPSKGRYIDPAGNVYDERSFDLEVVARQGFDPNPLWQQMVKEAKARNQDSVFLSEVVAPGTVPNANPGLEIYFAKRVDEATADAITKRINELGVDAGFTYAVDVRQANRAAQKSGSAPGDFVGIRVQYIPEFGGGLEGAEQARKRMFDLINELTNTPGVSNARMVEYDTQVAFGGDYDAILAGNLPGGGRAQWARQPSSESNQGAIGRGGVPSGDVGGEAVHRRRGGPAAPQGRERQKALDADLHDFVMNTTPRTPGRFAMGGPAFAAAVEPRLNALTRPNRGALSLIKRH